MDRDVFERYGWYKPGVRVPLRLVGRIGKIGVYQHWGTKNAIGGLKSVKFRRNEFCGPNCRRSFDFFILSHPEPL